MTVPGLHLTSKVSGRSAAGAVSGDRTFNARCLAQCSHRVAVDKSLGRLLLGDVPRRGVSPQPGQAEIHMLSAAQPTEPVRRLLSEQCDPVLPPARIDEPCRVGRRASVYHPARQS